MNIYESEETEMKRDKEWLKEKLNTEKNYRGTNELKTKTTYGELYDRGVRDGINTALEFVNQLQEPEVKQLERKIKELESYNDELIRDNNQLRNAMDNQEVLSEEFINENRRYASIHDIGYYIPVDKLQNLLVPKQEITEEQAWEIIHGKYGDEVLQNNIDYVESQGYVVIEKPTVPQFVADWHVQNKYYLLGAKFERIADSEDKRVVDWYGRCSGRHKNNRSNAQETIALMDLVGYEVEEEQKYYVIDKEDNILLIRGYEGIEKADNLKITNSGGGALKLTEQEIKDYDPRYWAFRKPVEEVE